MDPTIRLPAALAERLRAQSVGDETAAEPRDAATVVLIRAGDQPGPGGLEIHLMRRHTTMAFAGGMAVFPGGGVDPADFDSTIGWAGPSAGEWAQMLSSDEKRATALVCAAVRETFEETGVLLAGDFAGRVIQGTGGPDWERDREALVGHQISLADLLRSRNLVLRSDLLRPWALWTTPEFEPRRYRTWFLLAALPQGQNTRDVSSEAVEVEWVSVDAAIRRADSGDMLMLPPQYCTCLELHKFDSPTAVLLAERTVEHVSPTAGSDNDGAYLILPESLIMLGKSLGSQMYGTRS